MSNILFEYLYRDANNNKQYGQAVFANEGGLPLAEIESRIRASLSDGEWFKTGMVDLESHFFNGPESWTEDDHPWHEFERISETDLPPSDPAFPGPRRDIAQFVEAMEAGRMRKWDPDADPKIPIVVIVAPAEAWDLLRETLEVDSRSSAFDKDLRGQICEALESLVVLGQR